MIGILGRKVGMTQVFVEGKAIPVTVLEAGPCKVLYTRTKEKDGYSSVGLTFGKKSANKTPKSMKTVFAQAGVEHPAAIVREFTLDNPADYEQGQELTVDVLKDIKFVDVISTSKGKGFQGVMKRHNFAGGPASHGATLFHRRPGSIGNFACSGRVFPGKKMPGRMGNARNTVQNLKVIRVEADKNLLLIKGAIPGAVNSYIMVKPALKKTHKVAVS